MIKLSTFSILAFAFPMLATDARAADRFLDFAGGCKPYRLEGKRWAPVDAGNLDGMPIPANQILRDEAFTVFRSGNATYGVNQRCVKSGGERAAAERPAPVGRRRSAAPAPQRGDTQSAWAVVFAFGYNFSPSATRDVTYGGTTVSEKVKYTGSPSFFGEANYRLNATFRLAAELGLSQLQTDSTHGNETSFFDVRPEYIFRAGSKVEVYIGPMLGLFFLSQNAETPAFDNGNAFSIGQQTVVTPLLGLAFGADYALSPQFDLGFFVRYFKPGSIKVTGTQTAPTTSAYESKTAVSYLSSGLRFVIHF